MEERACIGIDPDSQKLVCCYLGTKNQKKEKSFPYTLSGLDSFCGWWTTLQNPIIAIEGRGGYSKEFERYMLKKEIVFYSLPPTLVHSTLAFHGSMRHKSNRIDAQVVARATSVLNHQGHLEKYRFVPDVYDGLKEKTRHIEKLSKIARMEYNQLWQDLGELSNDLRLYLSGHHNDYKSRNILGNFGVLRLLIALPDVSRWWEKTDNELHAAMGLGSIEKRRDFFKDIRRLSESICVKTRKSTQMVLSFSAENILRLEQQRDELEKTLTDEYSEDSGVQALIKIRGVGIWMATTIVGEIGNIDRFFSNDKLASYSGLGRRQYSTGGNNRQITPFYYNHRLKNAFMQAAHSITYHHGDKHLDKYLLHLKKNFGANESYKRVARALVRTVFRKLKEASSGETEKSKEGSAA